MRKLHLKKETLAELGPDLLSEVVGGTIYTKYGCTESYQVCPEDITRAMCAATVGACIVSKVGACIPTQGC